jgi:hypothetical protein
MLHYLYNTLPFISSIITGGAGGAGGGAGAGSGGAGVALCGGEWESDVSGLANDSRVPLWFRIAWKVRIY